MRFLAAFEVMLTPYEPIPVYKLGGVPEFATKAKHLLEGNTPIHKLVDKYGGSTHSTLTVHGILQDHPPLSKFPHLTRLNQQHPPPPPFSRLGIVVAVAGGRDGFRRRHQAARGFIANPDAVGLQAPVLTTGRTAPQPQHVLWTKAG